LPPLRGPPIFFPDTSGLAFPPADFGPPTTAAPPGWDFPFAISVTPFVTIHREDQEENHENNQTDPGRKIAAIPRDKA